MADTDRNPELDAFVDLVGRQAWQSRIDAIVQAQAMPGGKQTLSARDVLRRHAVEVAIERHRRGAARPLHTVDARIVRLATEAVTLHASLPQAGRRRFAERLEVAMLHGQSLTGLFHLLRTAMVQRRRSHEVVFSGLSEGTTHDLVVSRDGHRAEIACETVSAEGGRGLHQGAWSRLVDLVDPDLETWLLDHPGRYLLKMTLPRGLRVAGDPKAEAGPCALASLHRRIREMLAGRQRADQDENAVMRLDPLMFPHPPKGRSDANAPGVISRLREQFGPETQLAAITSTSGIFAIAAHAGGENDVPAAVRRRMETVAASRLSGGSPGILAMFVDDIGTVEWERLARDMSLEREARKFLTRAEARHVVTIACTSRYELFHPTDEEAEHRFRNAAFRGQAAHDALGSSTLSSCWVG